MKLKYRDFETPSRTQRQTNKMYNQSRSFVARCFTQYFPSHRFDLFRCKACYHALIEVLIEVGAKYTDEDEAKSHKSQRHQNILNINKYDWNAASHT